jgi:ABC-type multidrug transport system ATPase subunit
MKSALTIDDLRFAYGEGDVLQGVSLSVPAGEICAVIGQSGSGKTSLIKCLLMLERPTSGRVSYGRPPDLIKFQGLCAETNS